jgi:hypothetical protein
VTDPTARELGPGFICGAPGPAGLDAAAFTDLPGIDRTTLRGPCALRPLAPQPGALAVSCALTAAANPAAGVTGGFATSNSVVSQGPGEVPTGSVWTAYVSRSEATTQISDVPAGPAPKVPDVAGIDFLILRTTATDNPASDAFCAPGSTVRTGRVSAVQPDLGSGRIPDTAGAAMGGLVACFQPSGATTVRIRVPKADGTLEVQGSGTCAASPVAGETDPLQHCSLDVTPAGEIRDGLITSNGLVDAAATSRTRGPGVWTVSMLGSPPDAATPAPAAPKRPRTRVRAPRKARAGLIRVRWNSPTAGVRFDVQRGRRKSGRRIRWHTIARATTRRVLRLRVRPGTVHVRVRARSGTDRPGPWARRTIRVRGRSR